MTVLNLEQILLHFWNHIKTEKIEIYNEFSLQHELGIFLRNNLDGYKVQFERNVTFFNISKNQTIKKEIDICIFNENKTEVYAIELKYPKNGQYPEQMYAFIKDILFAEQLKKNGFIQACTVVMVDDQLFLTGDKKDGIYQYFREKKSINGVIYRPTGSAKYNEYIEVEGSYKINWQVLYMEKKCYTYVVSV